MQHGRQFVYTLYNNYQMKVSYLSIVSPGSKGASTRLMCCRVGGLATKYPHLSGHCKTRHFKIYACFRCCCWRLPCGRVPTIHYFRAPHLLLLTLEYKSPIKRFFRGLRPVSAVVWAFVPMQRNWKKTVLWGATEALILRSFDTVITP